jgi:hypothetical protein
MSFGWLDNAGVPRHPKLARHMPGLREGRG